MRIAINNGLVIDPANNIEKKLNIYIDGKTIIALGKAPENFQPENEIDAKGQYVIPGIIDLCARLREPGLEHKASILSETKAAAAAGITTLCQPPDTDPIADTTAVIELIHRQAEHAGYATILPIGALTQKLEGLQLSEMAALKEAGCVAVSNVFPIKNTIVLRNAFAYAATHDLTVISNPQDHYLNANGCAHEGAVAARLGLPGIPTSAETMAVSRDLALIEEVGVKAHFTQLSSARATQMIARAQFDGLPISCDTAAHQLFLTELDLNNFDANCHVLPPFRSERDKEGLRMGVKNNTIAAICSHHQPVDADDKARPFCATEAGISSLETLLPLTMKLVDEGALSLSESVARLTSGPASILNLNTGQLSIGSPADICLFDPNIEWQLNSKTILSLGHNTPFKDWYFKGKVTHTLHAGQLVFEL